MTQKSGILSTQKVDIVAQVLCWGGRSNLGNTQKNISRETFPKLTQCWGMSAKTLVCTKPCEGCQSNHGMLNENIASASLEVAARSLHEASEEWRPWWWWRWPLARLWGHAKKAAGGLRANGQSPFLYAPIASCYQPQGSLTHLGFLSSLCILCYVLTDTHTFVAENESSKILNLWVDADGIRSSSSRRRGGMDVFILEKQGRQLLSGLTP